MSSMERYFTLRKNKFSKSSAACMDLEGIILNEEEGKFQREIDKE